MAASIALRLQTAIPSRRTRVPRYSEMADEQLLLLVRKQKVEALQVLYDRYAPRALGLAYKILLDRDLAEQVIQDAFWRVWRKAEQYQPGRGRFSTWLFTIVHNLAIDQVRGRRSDVSLDEPQQAETIEAQISAADVDETVSRTLDGEHVRAALRALPGAQREVIELVYFEGLSHREAASRLSVPLGTIHTRARLGLEKLRAVLAR